jgi:Fic family protein
MDRSAIAQSPIGQLVPITAPDPQSGELVEADAYLPDVLPKSITLSTDTWNTVNAATASLARLDGAARLIPNPALLRRPALRREAHSTSALEGTYAPFEDVLAADVDDMASLSGNLREILNFETMAELAFSWPEQWRITLGMLSELQNVLVADTPGQMQDSGRLRDCVVVIGSRGTSIANARYIPPPPGDQLRVGVEEMLGWIAQPPDLPTVVQAAMAHYQFESLHPFSDGNGRLGRLLIIVQLLRGAIIREPLLVVSPWFENRRDRYQSGLFELSCTGDWDAWIAFFAERVVAAAEESRVKVERLVELQHELVMRVRQAKKRGTVEHLASALVGMPYVSAPRVAADLSVTGQSGMNAIKALVEIGILKPTGLRVGRRRGAEIYVANDVLSVIAPQGERTS